MTDRKKALKALLEKVEAGEYEEGFGILGTPLLRGYAEASYYGSLDAAKALHEALLPGWAKMIGTNSACVSVPDRCDGSAGSINGKTGFHARSDNDARAWLIAILRALIEQEGGE